MEGRRVTASSWLVFTYILMIFASLFLAVGGSVVAQDCGKNAELWFPPNGTTLDNGISIQEVTSLVCQGEPVTITTTLDNMSCGDADTPFDLNIYYDQYDAAHLIDTLHIDSLNGCEHITHQFTWNTAGIIPGTHTVLLWADPNNTVVELNEDNNKYEIGTVTVRPNAPLIEATKTYTDENGGYVNPEDAVLYTVVIENTGCADQGDNAGHEFVDDLPAGVTPTGAASASSGTTAITGNQVVWDGEIPAGGSVTITFEVKVDSDVEDGTDVCNQGVINWDADGDGTNDSQEPTDDPTTQVEDDPTCFTVHEAIDPALVGTIDAPTLSEWARITLTTAFAVVFILMLLRRRRTAVR